MIIEGKPELGLQKHQQVAYSKVSEAFNKGNKASVIIPTGCGKSFISLQLMIDNKDKNMLFMAPSNAIKEQMYKYIANYIVGEKTTEQRPAKMIAEEYFPNLKIMLYPTLLKMKKETMQKLRPDIIIMDELHRTGADKWGEKIETLLSMNESAKVLGLTATPNRMDDISVVDKLFDGNIDYELTLVEAIRNGIVKTPAYVKCDYSLRDSLESIRTAIEKCSNEQEKRKLQEKYDKMRKIVDQADGIPELFSKNLTTTNGKYIVFCRDIEHMTELMKKSKEWFASIDTEPEMYSVYSGEGYSESANNITIKNFEKSKSEHIKLLFSIDMLNEGLHVEDISGVIMARPTDSRIIYLQQLGRALSSDTSREQTIVFDLVNNYLKNNLDVEINKRNNTNRSPKDNSENLSEEFETDIEDIDIFRIQGETKAFLELLKEVQGALGHNDHLTNAISIKDWMELKHSTKPPSTIAKDFEEKKLGIALSNIRQKLIKPYSNLHTEQEKSEYIERNPDFIQIKQIIDWIDENNLSPYLINAREIKQWMERNNTANPPRLQAKEDEIEKRLGQSLSTIRERLIKPYLKVENENEKAKFEEKYPEIKEIMEIISWIDSKNLPPYLKNAQDIKKWIEIHKKKPSGASKNKQEKRLGTALAEIRRNLIKNYSELETEEKKQNFRMIHPEIDEVLQIVLWIDKSDVPIPLANARNIKQWMENKQTTRPPVSSSKDEEEKVLGRALLNIRQGILKTYNQLDSEELKEKYKKAHPEIDEIIKIVSEIDENNISIYLANARAIKEWVEMQEKPQLPRRSKNITGIEKELGNKISYIRQDLIKPYMSLQTEDERKKFIERNPDTEEVFEIITTLDIQCGNVKQKELAILIREDMEKRKMIREAIELEKKYEEQLVQQKKSIVKESSKGVSLDEQ